jgi:hypothetical protein
VAVAGEVQGVGLLPVPDGERDRVVQADLDQAADLGVVKGNGFKRAAAGQEVPVLELALYPVGGEGDGGLPGAFFCSVTVLAAGLTSRAEKVRCHRPRAWASFFSAVPAYS